MVEGVGEDGSDGVSFFFIWVSLVFVKSLVLAEDRRLT